MVFLIKSRGSALAVEPGRYIKRPQRGGTMKDKNEFLRTMMLSLLIFYSIGVYAQSVRNPQQDLSITFSSKRDGENGSVFGRIVNKSANAYPCVTIQFDLYTRYDLLPPGEKSRHLGVLNVEVLNLNPRAVQDYQKELPYKAGIGFKSISECLNPPPKVLPDAPKILSFTAEPVRIRAGETTTLQWRTTNTDQVFVGEANPEFSTSNLEFIRNPRAIESSGSLQVTPSQTIKYSLQAKKGGRSTIATLTVEVTSASRSGVCTISGQILKDKTEYATKIGLYRVGDTSRRLFSSAVNSTGQYRFINVPEGKYLVIAKGRYPFLGEKLGSLAPFPSSQEVTCQPNRLIRVPHFTIRSNEG